MTPGDVFLSAAVLALGVGLHPSRMEALTLVPKTGSANQVFTELATNFKLADEVRDAFIRAKVENLDEFRFFFDEESKVEPWVNKLKLGEDQGVQVARVRRAWLGCTISIWSRIVLRWWHLTWTPCWMTMSFVTRKSHFGGSITSASLLRYTQLTLLYRE